MKFIVQRTDKHNMTVEAPSKTEMQRLLANDDSRDAIHDYLDNRLSDSHLSFKPAPEGWEPTGYSWLEEVWRVARRRFGWQGRAKK